MVQSSLAATVYTEDQFIQLSALQHYVFCPRQCALIHVDDVWNDNVFTVRGNILHEKVDTDTYETRGTLKTVRALKIHSFRLGLAGKCDVVEFRKPLANSPGLQAGEHKAIITGMGVQPHIPANVVSVQEAMEVVPVEFKAGQPKQNISDEVQLCAQALCLEEMLDVPVRRGAFFYGKIRRRVQVEISDTLRQQTEEIVAAVHDIVDRKVIPQGKYEKKCGSCSLEDICQPKAMNERKLKAYIKTLYEGESS
jgi:CRISPR-associated exonuclease Cas4